VWYRFMARICFNFALPDQKKSFLLVLDFSLFVGFGVLSPQSSMQTILWSWSNAISSRLKTSCGMARSNRRNDGENWGDDVCVHAPTHAVGRLPLQLEKELAPPPLEDEQQLR